METKRIWPCVRCTKRMFRKKIAPKLKKMGYKLQIIGGTWEENPYIVVNYNGDERQITNHSKLFIDSPIGISYLYICNSIYEFLSATKAIAIERGWFKEEEVVVEKGTTTEKQDQESKNIIYRCEREQIDIVARALIKVLGIKDCTVPNATNDNTIFLVNTKDRRKFIRCLSLGNNKSNVIECSTLDEFLQKVGEFTPHMETEHKDAETVGTAHVEEGKEEAPSEKVEEMHPEPSTPTLAEARRQFRELTKHYSVEELSKPEPPRSWAEYIEQNPIADERTAEVEKKASALAKLVLLRDKWCMGANGDGAYAVVSYRDTPHHSIAPLAGRVHRPLMFPTPKMAADFLNTFSGLIEEAGDLI